MLKIAYHPVYAHPLPEGHRFPMLKYELIPAQLLHEGSITEQHLFAPAPCSDDIILLTHTQQYFHQLFHLQLTPAEVRRIGFPLSEQLVKRELIITQGTIDCCHFAFKDGISLNVAGGTHHAFPDRGEGFCLLNDMAIAANYLLNRSLSKKIAIIDLDVHQGNGTAKIFENQPLVYTFSMHGGNNYPFHKEKSSCDVPLSDGINDADYLELLQQHLHHIFTAIQPDFVFYLSGVDILSTDKFGKLAVSINGCKKRDEMVFTACQETKTPCVVAMGGGYSADIKIITEAHCNTIRAAKTIWNLD